VATSFPLHLSTGWKYGQGFIKERPLKNAQFYSRSRKTRILTTGILVVFRGLEFEPDAACPAIAFGDGGRLGKRECFSKVSRRQT
jgi:hypothetical protein